METLAASATGTFLTHTAECDALAAPVSSAARQSSGWSGSPSP